MNPDPTLAATENRPKDGDHLLATLQALKLSSDGPKSRFGSTLDLLSAMPHHISTTPAQELDYSYGIESDAREARDLQTPPLRYEVDEVIAQLVQQLHASALAPSGRERLAVHIEPDPITLDLLIQIQEGVEFLIRIRSARPVSLQPLSSYFVFQAQQAIRSSGGECFLSAVVGHFRGLI